MRYVAFLRAVNVGGRVVKMQDLKTAFESLPVKNVETFIASGNVIFETGVRDPALLERKAEAQLRDVFGYEIDTFMRSIDELQRIAECRPYQDIASSGEGGTVYVGFLRQAVGRDAQRRLKALSTVVDEFCSNNREVLWLHRNVPHASPTPSIEKVLGLRATFRNARTVRRIAERYRA